MNAELEAIFTAALARAEAAIAEAQAAHAAIVRGYQAAQERKPAQTLDVAGDALDAKT